MLTHKCDNFHRLNNRLIGILWWILTNIHKTAINNLSKTHKPVPLWFQWNEPKKTLKFPLCLCSSENSFELVDGIWINCIIAVLGVTKIALTYSKILRLLSKQNNFFYIKQNQSKLQNQKKRWNILSVSTLINRQFDPIV